MVKKKQLQEAIASNMEGRVLDGPQTVRKSIKSTAKSYKSHVVSIRFDSGDYETLQKIALEEGTTAASLVRKAVKNIIKETPSPERLDRLA
jgi:hypothetical protein